MTYLHVFGPTGMRPTGMAQCTHLFCNTTRASVLLWLLSASPFGTAQDVAAAALPCLSSSAPAVAPPGAASPPLRSAEPLRLPWSGLLLPLLCCRSAVSTAARSRSAFSDSALAMEAGSGSARTRSVIRPLAVTASTTWIHEAAKLCQGGCACSKNLLDRTYAVDHFGYMSLTEHQGTLGNFAHAVWLHHAAVSMLSASSPLFPIKSPLAGGVRRPAPRRGRPPTRGRQRAAATHSAPRVRSAPAGPGCTSPGAPRLQ